MPGAGILNFGPLTLVLACCVIPTAPSPPCIGHVYWQKCKHRLLLCLAHDTAKCPRAPFLTYPALLQHLLFIPSLKDTENFPGVLFLWTGCVLQFEEKISDVHVCMVWFEDVVAHCRIFFSS